ncbi:MAG: hypothetical protein HKN33_04545, partial [Pyrinomonadaceae bacterium]|nr:hypothetical protein [Pyrinomonadaceae bacterium]
MRKESDLPSIIADREKGLVKRGSRINSILKKISFFSKENGEKSDPAVSDSVEEEKHISFSAEDSEEPEVHTVNLLSSDSEKSAPADKEGKDPSTEDLSKLNGVSTESGAAVKPCEQSESEAGEKGAKKVHVVSEQQSVAEEDVHKANPDVPQEPEYVSTSAHEEGELKNAKSNSQPIENVVIPGDTGLRLVPVPLEDPPSVTQPKAQSTQDTEARAMDLKAEDIVPEVDSHSEPHLDRQKEDALINEVPVIPEFLLLSDEARVDPPEQEDTELTCGKNGYVGSEKPESVETRKEEATNSMRDEDRKRNEGNTPEPYRSEPDIHQEQEPSHEHESREQQWGEPDIHQEQEPSHEYESHDQQWGDPESHHEQKSSHEHESHDQQWG